MGTMPNNFQVILVSSESQDVFPQNTSSCFCSVLPQNLNIKSYDIGLANITFKDIYRKPWADADTLFPPLTKQNTPFFNELYGENEIIYASETTKFFYIKRESDNLISFVTALNEKCAAEQWNLTFTMKLTSGDVERIIMRYVDPDKYDLQIDKGLAESLGFLKNTFSPGAYKGDRKPNLDIFGETETFGLVRSKWEKKVLKVPQLYDPSLEDITIKIHETLALNRVSHVTFDLDDQTSTLLVDTGSTRQILKLSSRLNTYLGQPPDKVFKNLETVRVPSQIIDPFRVDSTIEYISRLNPSNTVSCHKIFVTASIIKDNIVGSRNLPVIATIERIDGNREYNYSPHPVMYFEPSQAEAKVIKIQLLSDQLVPIDHQGTPTVCVLHFRRKRI